MKHKIAVFGAGNVGLTMASDLTLAGYEVNLLESPRLRQKIAGIQRLGGINLHGDRHALVSGKTGFAKLNMITTDPKVALKNVDVVFVDVPVTDYEARFKTIVPYLENGQIVNFSTYGYWASLRVVDILKRSGKENVTLSESPTPVYWSSSKDSEATSVLMRKNVPLGVFPSRRSAETNAVLKSIFPTFEEAVNVLQTNLENMNMIVHPGIALLNLASFDKLDEPDRKFDFYVSGNTNHTGILQEAQDRERMFVCQAYGVPYTPAVQHIVRYYGSKGTTMYEAIHNCKPYQGLIKGSGWSIDLAYLMDCMGGGDIPLLLVPFVSLADIAGISTPIARAMVELFGAIFETNFWKTGLTLDKLGLGNLTPEEVVEYVTSGELDH